MTWPIPSIHLIPRVSLRFHPLILTPPLLAVTRWCGSAGLIKQQFGSSGDPISPGSAGATVGWVAGFQTTPSLSLFFSLSLSHSLFSTFTLFLSLSFRQLFFPVPQYVIEHCRSFSFILPLSPHSPHCFLITRSLFLTSSLFCYTPPSLSLHSPSLKASGECVGG